MKDKKTIQNVILLPVSDWIFKLLFGDERNKSILIDLLKSFIDLPDEEYDLTLMDTHLKPEFKDDKLGILDVRIRTKSGKIIDIEIQICPFIHIGKRISFYKSKLIVGQIGESQDFNDIKKVICILITDYTLFPQTGDYVNRFRFYNISNGLCFEDIPEEICTVELPKIPPESDGSAGWNWTRFFNARTKEEFEMIAQTNTEIRRAVDRLYELSADKKVRAEYDRRRKAQMDYQAHMKDHFQTGMEEGIKQGMEKGREEGIQEGMQKGIQEGMQKGIRQGMEKGIQEKANEVAIKLLKKGLDPELIAESTGLPVDAVRSLKNSL